MTLEAGAIVLSWVAIVALAFAMSGLLRQVHVLTSALLPARHRMGPALGTMAPRVDGLGGQEGWPQVTAILFADSSCEACKPAVTELASCLEGDDTHVEAVIIYPHEGPTMPTAGLRLVEHQDEAFQRFGIPVTPFAVGVNSDGMVVAAEPVGSRKATRRFVDLLKERTVAL
jgi:hypothetical protein